MIIIHSILNIRMDIKYMYERRSRAMLICIYFLNVAIVYIVET